MTALSGDLEVLKPSAFSFLLFHSMRKTTDSSLPFVLAVSVVTSAFSATMQEIRLVARVCADAMPASMEKKTAHIPSEHNKRGCTLKGMESGICMS